MRAQARMPQPGAPALAGLAIGLSNAASVGVCTEGSCGRVVIVPSVCFFPLQNLFKIAFHISKSFMEVELT